MTAPEMWQLLLAGSGALAGVVWWFVRHTHTKVEHERRDREAAVAKVTDDVTDVSVRLSEHRLHVAENYVNRERLAEALKPLEGGIGRVEGTLERLFGELKGKMDKPGGG